MSRVVGSALRRSSASSPRRSPPGRGLRARLDPRVVVAAAAGARPRRASRRHRLESSRQATGARAAQARNQPQRAGCAPAVRSAAGFARWTRPVGRRCASETAARSRRGGRVARCARSSPSVYAVSSTSRTPASVSRSGMRQRPAFRSILAAVSSERLADPRRARQAQQRQERDGRRAGARALRPPSGRLPQGGRQPCRAQETRVAAWRPSSVGAGRAPGWHPAGRSRRRRRAPAQAGRAPCSPTVARGLAPRAPGGGCQRAARRSTTSARARAHAAGGPAARDSPAASLRCSSPTRRCHQRDAVT